MNTKELSRSVIRCLRDTAGRKDCDDHFAIDKWEWPQGVALHGILSRHAKDGNPEDLAFLSSWFERGIASGLPVRNVNTSAPLLTLCGLLKYDSRPEWSRLCLDWAEWIMKDMPRTEERGLQHVTSHLVNPGELWADTLFMTVLFLAKAGIVFRRPDFSEEAAYQFLLHIRYLADTEPGLWYHGWTFAGRHHYGKVHWARGNAWFTVAAVEYLEMTKDESPAGKIIREAFLSQARALASCQGETGLWHTILDDHESYVETSASAAIAFGCLKAIRLGILGPEFKSMALKAAGAVAGKIDDDGMVGGVSHGTALGMDREHYLKIPVSPTAYGQGLVFLMLGEVS